MGFEHIVKMSQAVITTTLGDLCDAVLGLKEHLSGVVHANGRQVLHRGTAEFLFENGMELTGPQKAHRCQLRDGDRVHEMRLHVSADFRHPLITVGNHELFNPELGQLAITDDRQEHLLQLQFGGTAISWLPLHALSNDIEHGSFDLV